MAANGFRTSATAGPGAPLRAARYSTIGSAASSVRNSQRRSTKSRRRKGATRLEDSNYSDSRRRTVRSATTEAVGLAKTDHPPSPDVACHPSRSSAFASGESRVVNAHPMS